MEKIEVMAPAGSYESLQAAIKSGADSVYFGVQQLNMRARSSINFTLEDLKNIVSICKEKNVKTYLALNTLMYDHDMKIMRKVADAAKSAGITAIIISDLAALQYANSIGLEVHMSTQTNVANYETVKFYSKFADVIVLARELTLKQIKDIHENIKKDQLKGPSGELVRLEAFAHGAMCVAVSGRCYMSIGQYNASPNRGACLQECRRAYTVIDKETGYEMDIDNEYVMSSKDMCTIGFIDKMIDAGITVLKIEGRGRAPEYVHTVTKCYREALDSIFDGTYSKEKIDAWITKLKTVYNRDFWDGFYMGRKIDSWSGSYGSQATTEKFYLGRIINYFKKAGVAEIHLESGEINIGDKLLITGVTTGVVEGKIDSIFVDEKPVERAGKGQTVTIPVPETLRKNDRFYIVKDRLPEEKLVQIEKKN